MKISVHARLKKLSALLLAIVGIQGYSYAQLDVGEIVQAGSGDASKLAQAYLAPLIRGFGTSMNQGWYNTAKTHGLGRFDVTISFNAAFVPDKDLSFDATQLGFQKLTIKPGTGPMAPTVLGDTKFNNPAIYQLTEDFGGSPVLVAEFASPDGLGLPYSGAPTAQLTVGLIKNTEVMVRYIPTISAGDADLGLIGFGVKHDIKQWIPVVKKLPFDLAGYFGYTKFNAEYGLTISPQDTLNPYSGITNANFNDQALTLNTTATTFGIIASKKLLALTVYGAVNYQSSTTDVEMSGNYPLNVVEDEVGNPNLGSAVYTNIQDPISFSQSGANGFTGTLGLRLKLLILTLHGSYTFAQYPIATAGIGINLDWK